MGNRVASSKKDKIAELPTPTRKAYLASTLNIPLRASPPPPTQPLFTTEYFVVKPSEKKGFGAFAIRDITKGTVIIAEKPLFLGEITQIYCAFEEMTKEQQTQYLSLYGFPGVDLNRILRIYKTNR